MAKRNELTAKEAAAELGISVATLYAYVSRGLVRSEPTEGKSRAKRYNGEDIAALKQKQRFRHSPDEVGRSSLKLGVPVLDSAITLFEGGQLYYGGYNAVELAETRSYEEVAALLWTGSFTATPFFEAQQDLQLELPYLADELGPIERFQTFLPLAAARDLSAYDRSELGLRKTGGRLLRLLTFLATGRRRFESIAAGLTTTWAANRPELRHPIEAALILCADHELNVSAFTARCIASAGSTLYQVMQGGLAALQGHRHGGQSGRVAALFDQVSPNVEQRLVEWIKQQQPLPGFGHPLYPEGDPRGKALMGLAKRYGVESAQLKMALKIERIVGESLGRQINIDFGLVTLARTLGLPPEAPLTLFAIGRSSGWIAHALEQYATHQLIRPRARYVGDPIRDMNDQLELEE